MLIDNKDGTVTDTETRLMWQQATNDKMAWKKACTYCKKLDLAGYNDWRLPTIKELVTIVDYSKQYPAIDAIAFPDTPSNHHWSSTNSVDFSELALRLNFSNGYIYSEYKYNMYHFRAVRTILQEETIC